MSARDFEGHFDAATRQADHDDRAFCIGRKPDAELPARVASIPKWCSHPHRFDRRLRTLKR